MSKVIKNTLYLEENELHPKQKEKPKARNRGNEAFRFYFGGDWSKKVDQMRNHGKKN